MVKLTFGTGGSIPCWPIFWYNSNKHKQKRRCHACCSCATYYKKQDYKSCNCGYCLCGYRKSPTLLHFWFLILFIYRSALSTLFWSICLLFIYRKDEDGGVNIRILFLFVIKIPPGGVGSTGFYVTIFYLIKFHKKEDGYRLWILLLFIRVQSHRKTYVLFPFYSYRWVDNEYIQFQFLLYYTYQNLFPQRKESINTLFPLYYYSSEGDNYYNFLLAGLIRWSKSGDIYKKRFFIYGRKVREGNNPKISANILLFVNWTFKGEKKKYHIYPFFYLKSKPDKIIWYLLPVCFYYSKRGNNPEKFVWFLLYFYYYNSYNDESFHLLFPLFTRYNSERAFFKFFWIWYSYYKKNGEKWKRFTFPPIYYNKKNYKSHKKWIFPFYYFYEDLNTHKKTVSYFPIVTLRYINNVLYQKSYLVMIYSYRQAVEGSDIEGFDILWPFIRSYRKTNGEYLTRVVPFYYKRGDTKSYIKYIFPIFAAKYVDKAGEGFKREFTFIIPFYYHRNRSETDFNYYFAILYFLPPYIWYSKYLDTTDVGFWPFFSRKDTSHKTSYTVFYPIYRYKKYKNSQEEKRNLAFLYSSKTSSDGSYVRKQFLCYYYKQRGVTQKYACYLCGCLCQFLSIFSIVKIDNLIRKGLMFPIINLKKDLNSTKLGIFWIFHRSFGLIYYSTRQNHTYFRIPLLIKFRYNGDNLDRFALFWIGDIGLIYYEVNGTRKDFYIFLFFYSCKKSENVPSELSIVWLFSRHASLFFFKDGDSLNLLPIYQSKKVSGDQWQTSLFGYRRAALFYKNDSKGLLYIIPIYFRKYNTQTNETEVLSLLGISPSVSIIRYKIEKSFRIFPIYFTKFNVSSGKNSWSIIGLSREFSLIRYIPDKLFRVCPLFYKYNSGQKKSTSLLWIFSRRISLLFWKEKNNSDETLFLFLFGLIWIKHKDNYINGRFLYRLLRFKWADGSLKRLEFNPILFCNYNGTKDMCLACGGCIGHTHKGYRCCWCVNLAV